MIETVWPVIAVLSSALLLLGVAGAIALNRLHRAALRLSFAVAALPRAPEPTFKAVPEGDGIYADIKGVRYLSFGSAHIVLVEDMVSLVEFYDQQGADTHEVVRGMRHLYGAALASNQADT